jgi:hypothetical protein
MLSLSLSLALSLFIYIYIYIYTTHTLCVHINDYMYIYLTGLASAYEGKCDLGPFEPALLHLTWCSPVLPLVQGPTS